YYWTAFRAVAGKLVVGSYTGNGTTLSITGVGFSPALVMVMHAGANDPVFRTSASTSSCDFQNTACDTTTMITALGVDGFTVANGARVNTNGQTYYYAAWK